METILKIFIENNLSVRVSAFFIGNPDPKFRRQGTFQLNVPQCDFSSLQLQGKKAILELPGKVSLTGNISSVESMDGSLQIEMKLTSRSGSPGINDVLKQEGV